MTGIEWRDASYTMESGGLRVQAWVSADGRFKIEQHPLSDGRCMLTDAGFFVDVYPGPAAARDAAEEVES
jgi:hypothetical protein